MIGLRRAHTQSQQEAPNACSAESTNHPGIVAPGIPAQQMQRERACGSGATSQHRVGRHIYMTAEAMLAAASRVSAAAARCARTRAPTECLRLSPYSSGNSLRGADYSRNV